VPLCLDQRNQRMNVGLLNMSKLLHTDTVPGVDDKEKEKFEDLHKSIRACDEVLSSVEVNLTSFQKDLAAVSAEIETLQARSSALSIRLENRKQVETGLGPIVEDISLSPAVVKKIIDGAIDEAWVKSLDEVEKRSKAMNSKTVNQKHIKGLADLKPLLENLISKVSRFPTLFIFLPLTSKRH